MTEPKVSIILCCYNQKDYVRDAIKSALDQTHRNIELVAIDNGSTDGSDRIMEEFRRDPRVILLLYEDNGNMPQRLNEGFARSSGEFISFLWADDYYLPEKTRMQVDTFEELDATFGLVYSPGYRLNVITKEKWLEPSLAASGFILKNLLLDFHTQGCINPISPLFRRECYLRYPQNEQVRMDGDSVFFRMALSYKFKYLDTPLVVMRDHLSNMGKAFKTNEDNVRCLLEMLEHDKGFPADLRPALDIFRSRVWMTYGWQGIRVMEDPRWARACLLQAIRWRRDILLNPRTVLGLTLSLLSPAALRWVNLLANRLSREKGNRAYKDDY